VKGPFFIHRRGFMLILEFFSVRKRKEERTLKKGRRKGQKDAQITHSHAHGSKGSQCSCSRPDSH